MLAGMRVGERPELGVCKRAGAGCYHRSLGRRWRQRESAAQTIPTPSASRAARSEGSAGSAQSRSAVARSAAPGACSGSVVPVTPISSPARLGAG